MTERDEIIVVGGGLAGLVVARDLAIADRRVTLLEASDRLGGRIASATLDGLDGLEIDVGTADFEPHGAMSQLATELGLEVVTPSNDAPWVIGADGHARPLPTVQLLGIPAAPLVREVIDLIGTRAALRAQLDAVIPMVRTSRTRSLGELVRRRMGRTVVDRLVAPIVRTTHTALPDELPVELAARRLPAALARSGTLSAAVAFLRAVPGPDVVGLAGGLHGLVAALEGRARRVGVAIRTNARVDSLDATGVRLDDGEELRAAHVVIATGAAREDGPTSLFVAVDAAALDAKPRGARAFVAAGAPGITARAFEHLSAMWPWIADQLPPHRHLVRLEYEQRPADPEATAANDLRMITGAQELRVVGITEHTGAGSVPAAEVPAGVVAVGAAAHRTTIGDLVEHARAAAADLVASTAEP